MDEKQQVKVAKKEAMIVAGEVLSHHEVLSHRDFCNGKGAQSTSAFCNLQRPQRLGKAS
ncbi:MAG TPA: hypothetical protein VHZ55_09495 [Bryobacteraceae bacterium]|jgi:hypothetical protein|nr:hypothetical protein [Bryobacteraceae bacterium]